MSSRPADGPARSATARFGVLDALRGIAALAVFMLHVDSVFGTGSVVQHAYLSVDFFFLISGIVIANAYEHRLQQDVRIFPFLTARLRRIYPLYLLGTLLGMAAVLGSGGVKLSDVLILGVLTAALIPLLGGNPDDTAFRLNGPFWSLFFEIVINLVYGLIGARASNRALKWVIAVSGGVLLVQTLNWNGGFAGWSVSNFWGGFARVGFSFPMGVLLYRLQKSGHLTRFQGAAPNRLILMFVAVVCLPVIGTQVPYFNGVVDFGVVAIFFPLLGALAMQARASMVDAVSYSRLAAVSYPLYATHYPVLFLGMEAGRALHLGPVWTILLAMVSAISLAGALAQFPKRGRHWTSTAVGRTVMS